MYVYVCIIVYVLIIRLCLIKILFQLISIKIRKHGNHADS